VQPAEVSLADVPVDGLFLTHYAEKPVLVRRSADDEIEAISLVCTHLGCTVEWQPDEQQFYCPCHEGKFDAEGRAVAGPPKVPLQRLKVERQGDTILIGEPL
jgi:Rieske Fe-S protein